MAATIARAQGFTKDGRPKAGEATRLGQGYAHAEANTWRTFVTVNTHADGRVYIEIRRDDQTLAYVSVNPETETQPCVELRKVGV